MAAKPKKYTQNQMQGARGESLVQLIAQEMGFLYNPTGMDAGIDGEIEIRDPATEEVTGQVVRVQSKSRRGDFLNETESSFEYRVEEADLVYWLSANTPVILVLSRPEDREAFWVCIQDYFDNPDKRKSRKVTFDKNQDRFDKSAAEKLIDLARNRKHGLYINPVPKQETLYSNLLHLSRIPKKIYSAETEYRRPGALFSASREHGIWLRRGWSTKSKRLWGIHDLSAGYWPKFCDVGTMETYDASEWAHSDDVDRQNLFRWLVQGALEELLFKRGVRYDRALKHYHFMAPRQGLKDFKIGYRNHKGNFPEKTVFKKHSWNTAEGEKHYYKHFAFKPRFERIAGRWYLRIIPTYRYTWDGKNVLQSHGRHASGIKKLEKNKSVFSLVEMWAYVLSSDSGMFETARSPIGFGKLLRTTVPVGIPDDLWRAKEADGDSAVETLFTSKHRDERDR